MFEVDEAWCRRTLARHDLRLEKCRERKWETSSASFGKYRIVRRRDNLVVDGCSLSNYSLTLDMLAARCADSTYLTKLL
jgi:hypothetical protein